MITINTSHSKIGGPQSQILKRGGYGLRANPFILNFIRGIN